MQVQVLPRVTVQDETRLKAEVKKIRDLSVEISAGGAMENGDPVTRELDADPPWDVGKVRIY